MAAEDLSNNYYMSSKINTQHPAIVAILKGHPIYTALTKNVNVPKIYLTQLWTSIRFVPGTLDSFQFELTSSDEVFGCEFDLDRFRRTIGFPLQNAYLDKNDFDPIPDDKIIIDTINALGYDGHFDKVTRFKRKYLSRQWCTLYMILNRCLAPSQSGMDTITKSLMTILYGVAYHRHIDFAQVIWTQLIKIVNSKASYENKKYIPFIRFFSIMIDYFLTTNFNIPTLDDEPQVVLSAMKYVQANTGSEIAQPAPIPEMLLALADRRNKDIKEYRALVSPVQPHAPTQREPGEGSSRQGSKEGQKREGDLGIDVQQARRLKRHHDVQAIEEQTQPIQPQLEPIQKQVPEPIPLAPIPEPEPQMIPISDTEPTSSGLRVKTVHKHHKKKKTHKKRRVLEAVQEEAVEPPAGQENVPSLIRESDPIVAPTPESQSLTASGSEDLGRDFPDNAFNFSAFKDQNTKEIQGGNEGAVENLKESEPFGCEIGSKEKDDPPQTTPERQDTTSSTQTHALLQGIEEDVSCSLTHARKPPSNSVSSQQEIVSSSHRDLTHNLPTCPLEMVGNESRGTLPWPLPSFDAPLSSKLRSLSVESSESTLRGSTHLRDVAGTNVETKLTVASRGSLGNPVSANILPTLSTGQSTRLSGALMVSTERLSDTGHAFTPFVPPEIQTHIDTMAQRSFNTTMTPPQTSQTRPPIIIPTLDTTVRPFSSPTQTQPQIPQPIRRITQTPHTTSNTQQTQFTHQSPSAQSFPSTHSTSFDLNNLNFHEIRTVFHAILLMTPNLTPIDTAILSLLNSSITTQSLSADLTPVLTRLDHISIQVETFNKRLASLESCRPFPFPYYRRHDPDSHCPHEGENRGIGSSYAPQGQFSSVTGSQGAGEGTSHGSESGAQDNEGFHYSEYAYESDEEGGQPKPHCD